MTDDLHRKLDALGRSLDDHAEQSRRRIGELHRKVDDLKVGVAENVARLTERSEQHEKRLDRADRRSTGAGAIGGGGVAALLVGLKHLLGLDP